MEPRNKPSCICQLIFDKGAKNTQWREEHLFNNWSWGNWIITCRKMKLILYLTPLTKINSKWIKDLIIRPETINHKTLNARPETVQLLEGNIRKNSP